MKKKIILALPYLYGLEKCIQKNLEYCGFDVITFCYNMQKTHFTTPFSPIKLLYDKYIKKSSEYKKYLKLSPFFQDISDKIASLQQQKADYALFIRANIFPKSFVQQVSSLSQHCVNYQWDGIDVFPDILEYTEFFNDFYVFDQSDVKKYAAYHVKPTTNFFFDFPLTLTEQKQHSSGIYFLGGYNADRNSEIKNFVDTANHCHLPLDFYIVSKQKNAQKMLSTQGITHLLPQESFTFEKNLQKVQYCDAVVDFVNPNHSGLSFRVFDAMCFNKKLITTNKTIKNYDFYHPNNILIWENNTPDSLCDFLAKPYQLIDENIKNYYSFSAWIERILKGLD